MTATDIANFQCAVGEFVDAMASFRKTVAYQGAIAAAVAANQQRAACGHSPAYSEREFYEIAKEHGFAE